MRRSVESSSPTAPSSPGSRPSSILASERRPTNGSLRRRPTSPSPRSRCSSRRRPGSLRPRRGRDGAARGEERAARRASPTGRSGSYPKRRRCGGRDFCYVNDGSLEELDAFVAGVLEELRRLLRRWIVAAVVVLRGARCVRLPAADGAAVVRASLVSAALLDERPRLRVAGPSRSRAAGGRDRGGEQVQLERASRAPAPSASCS